MPNTPVHGYMAHLATDQEARLIRSAAITTVNIHDAAELEAVLPRGL
jgi:IS5 family transposase